MSQTIIKAHDTAVEFRDVLTLNREPFDLSGCAVKFLMRRDSTAFADDAVIGSSTGAVSYQPGLGFPTALGDWLQEWEVTLPDETILTFPDSGYNRIIIIEDLNSAPANSSLISDFREPVRVLIGDNDPDIQLRENSQIDAAIRLVVNSGKVSNRDESQTYTLVGAMALTPVLQPASDAHAWAKLVYHTARLFVTDVSPTAWRTRAFAESVGENREKVFALLEDLWKLENGIGCASSDYEE